MITLITSSRKYQLHAEMVETGFGHQPPDVAALQQRMERSLNRMERIASVYLGHIHVRLVNGLQLAFETAEAAILAACEMQHRCAALPQVPGSRVFLNIGIHQGIELRRAKEDAGGAVEIAALLAEVSDGIVVSGDVIAALKQELRVLAQPYKGLYPEIAAQTIDWRREIPSTAYGGASVSSGGMGSILKGVYLILLHNLKLLELARDKPVLTIGRDSRNDLVLAGSHVSRNHCRIERQGDRVVLTDMSSNGSFVTPEGGKEQRVVNASVTLSGKGIVFFGRESRGERRGGARYEVCS